MFSMHKRLGAVNRMNPPGPVENIASVAATVSLKGGGGGGWVSEGGSWKGLLCSFIGSTITTIPSANLAVQHCTSNAGFLSELRPGFVPAEVSETFRALSAPVRIRVHSDGRKKEKRKKEIKPRQHNGARKPSGHLCCDKNRFVTILLQIRLPKRRIEARPRG